MPKILLVDDSVTVLTLMGSALRNVGYEVEVALEGNEALQKIVLNKPNCVVLDIILPGINGYTICRQIRARDPQHILPILFISTKNTLFDRNYGLSLGADHYLGKPFTQDMLIQAVWSVLPAHLRPLQTTQPQKPNLRFVNLIPRRRDDPALLTTKNPFVAKTPQMDRLTQELYQAMDGRKKVKILSMETGLDMQKMIEILKKLVEQKLIELYDPDERKVVSLLDYL